MFAKFVTWLKSLFYKKELQACLIGLQNAGKTTLTNALCNDPDRDNTIPTIGFNVREVTKGKVNLHLWDLGGQNKFRNLWERYCNDAQCIVYSYGRWNCFFLFTM
ncbi:ADP-ribosylation_factor [Hexamita inflata]|uniref:ADP-ribosylation factor n=1 Tax=Hexamita inflata TaxID=28002 RepID=A0AA86QF15_9EUKA|nr:ADP-ribosylation factor [Hexamita inflata]